MLPLAALPAFAAAAAALIGLAQAGCGWLAVRRFAASAQQAGNGFRPPISVLKPLHGTESMLEEALASFCAQDYPDYQLVFGVTAATDGALEAVRRVAARFPARDIAVVADATLHGPNRKIGNLINMLPAARHDVLVIADSDIHAAPDYLARLADSLAMPGVGLVTTLYAGWPVSAALAARLGATQITHAFLPGVLLARAMGRQDSLGATMALRRDVLARIGGLEALVPHLADDAVLGRLVTRAGLGVALAATVPMTTVAEATLAALWQHELRWGRTIRSLTPLPFALSVLQYPLVWAVLALVLADGAAWAVGLVLLCWLGRALAAHGVDRVLARFGTGLASRVPFWLLPLRDLLSVAVVVASFAGDRVTWRGESLRATPPELAAEKG